MNEKGQLLKLNREVHADEADPGRDTRHDGREVENAAYASLDDSVGDRLSGFGGDGEDRQFGLGLTHDVMESIQRVHLESFDSFSDLFRVGIEESDKSKPMPLEALVSQEGTGQIADANDNGEPFAIHAQTMAKRGDQLLGGITDAGLAKATKIGKIFADLRVGNAEGLAKHAAGDITDPLALEAFEMAKIETETGDAGSGETRFVTDSTGVGC